MSKYTENSVLHVINLRLTAQTDEFFKLKSRKTWLSNREKAIRQKADKAIQELRTRHRVDCIMEDE